MAVRIRLSRIGKKHAPFYRVVAIDSRSKRDGEFLDNIGTYDVLKSSVVRFDEDLYQSWIAKGALPSDSAKKIYRVHKRSQKGELITPKHGAPKVASKATSKANSSEQAVEHVVENKN